MRVVHWYVGLWTIALLLWTGAQTCAVAAIVETRDGQAIEGAIRLEKDHLVVKPPAGAEVRIGLTNLRQATLNNTNAPSGSPADAAPAAKPAPKPGRITGLRAEYYSDTQFKDLKLVRVDPKIEFFWWDAPPAPELPRPFSARWTGRIEPACSETYTFRAEVNEGCRLWIDNRLVIDHWQGPPGNSMGKIALKAGQLYDFKFEFRSHPRGGNALLIWSSTHQEQQVVPSSRLSPPPGLIPPAIRIIAPRAEALVAAAPTVSIDVEASDPDGAIRKVEFFVDNRLIGQVDRQPWRIQWHNASPGCHKVYARATDQAGISATSSIIPLAIGSQGNTTLGSPWLELPVGETGSSGSVTGQNGIITLKGGGDFWRDRGAFHYVCQPLEGDGSIVARLTEFDGKQQPGSVGGLLVRESLSADTAREAFLGAAGEGGFLFSRREQVWEDRRSTEDRFTLPCWLKLSRHGKQIRAYRSDDGLRWQILEERKIDMPRTVFAGMMIATPGDQPGHATFDHAAVLTGSPTVLSSVKGIMLRSGSLVAGDVHSLNNTSVKMWRRNGGLTIPTSDVAWVLFQPITAEVAERLEPGRRGAMLSNGDFYEGDIASIKDGKLHVASILFGTRTFPTHNEVTAAVLHDLAPATCPYEVRTTDGSILKGKALHIDRDNLLLIEARDLRLLLPAAEVSRIRTAD